MGTESVHRGAILGIWQACDAGVDAAAALSIYQDDLEDKVAGLALVQSPYGGTPVAADMLREGQIADKETWRIMEFLICKLIKVNLALP